MDALLLPFLAALLCEIGAPTQLLGMLLAARFGPRKRVLGGIATAALVNSFLAAAAGRLVHGLINYRAIALMVGLSLLLTGASALLRAKPPELARYGGAGPFLASFLGVLILGFGDNGQFVTLTLAARADSLWLTALGAAAGATLAAVPAVMLSEGVARAVPVKAIRRGIAIPFLLVGAIVVVQALGLV